MDDNRMDATLEYELVGNFCNKVNEKYGGTVAIRYGSLSNLKLGIDTIEQQAMDALMLVKEAREFLIANGME